MDIKERFLAKVNKTERCWLWTAASRGNGYGAIKYGKKVVDAHRVSFLLFKEEIPEGLLICHTCDNRLCVNPEHLFLGTYSDNTQDCLTKGRMIIPRGIKFEKGFVPPNAELSEEVVKLIKLAILKGDSKAEIALRHNIKYQTVRDIARNKSYINVIV